MLLAVDIGNTNINSAVIDNKGKILKKFTINPHSTDAVERGFHCVSGTGVSRGWEIEEVVIVSVAPEILRKVKRGLRKQFRRARIIIVGRDVKVPMKCLYSKGQIGQDRLITAFAASSLYGLPALIIDFGTAVTFDVVSGKMTYLGGLIVPGVKMSLESLHDRTAMLPKTYLRKTRLLIGRDTASSIRSGMIYGYGALCKGLVKLFKKKLGKNIKIVATGGDAPLLTRHVPSVKNIDLNLSLKGLYLLSKKFQKNT